jgi:hypothetical protein
MGGCPDRKQIDRRVVLRRNVSGLSTRTDPTQIDLRAVLREGAPYPFSEGSEHGHKSPAHAHHRRCGGASGRAARGCGAGAGFCAGRRSNVLCGFTSRASAANRPAST